MPETRDEKTISEAGLAWMWAQSVLRDVKSVYGALDLIDEHACQVLACTNPAGVIERSSALDDAIDTAKELLERL